MRTRNGPRMIRPVAWCVVFAIANQPLLAHAAQAQRGMRVIAGSQASSDDSAVDLYGSSWALVIGINRYTQFPPLNYGVADAEFVAEALLDQGFPERNVFLLTDENATRSRILSTLQGAIRKKSSKKDRLLIYFAGHGETERLPGGGQEGWLIPVDGDPNDLPLTAISMKTLHAEFDRLPPKHKMLVADACYGGYTLLRSSGSAPDPAYLARITQDRVVRVLTAGGADETVQEKDGHGVLTGHFVKGIRGAADNPTQPDGIVTGLELYQYVSQRVFRDSGKKQLPKFGSLAGDGEFIFVADGSTPKIVNPDDGITLIDPSRQSAAAAPTIEDEESWYEKWWVWAIAGVVVAGGVGAALAAGGGDDGGGGGTPEEPETVGLTIDLAIP